jgi:hypothetical protein
MEHCFIHSFIHFLASVWGRPLVRNGSRYLRSPHASAIYILDAGKADIHGEAGNESFISFCKLGLWSVLDFITESLRFLFRGEFKAHLLSDCPQLLLITT